MNVVLLAGMAQWQIISSRYMSITDMLRHFQDFLAKKMKADALLPRDLSMSNWLRAVYRVSCIMAAKICQAGSQSIS